MRCAVGASLITTAALRDMSTSLSPANSCTHPSKGGIGPAGFVRDLGEHLPHMHIRVDIHFLAENLGTAH